MLIHKKIYEYLESKEKLDNYNLIDYTKISDTMNSDIVKQVCKETEDNNFYCVTVLPEYVAIFKSFSKNSFKVSSMIDFPKGNSGVKTKIKEIERSIINGANEIDVVINYNLIKNNDQHEILDDEIREITEFCHKESIVVKVTIEIGALSYQEIENICKMCINNNVDFITTSTGKLPNDNTFETKLEKVNFMRKILPDEVKIKFTGGVREYSQIKELSPFVDRIGTSVIIH